MAQLPNFLIIGAAKSGTTSLADYLSQHPDVFIPNTKEPNYFALKDQDALLAGPASQAVLKKILYNWSVTDWDAYCDLFSQSAGKKAIGEASVRYLYFPHTAARINATIPNVKLIVILRHPVSRLYSHYSMNRQILLEPLELRAAVEQEADRIAAGWGWDWHYTNLGFYAQQLSRYFKIFDRRQIAVFFYDDFTADPNRVYGMICDHIGVHDDFRPDMRARGMVSSRPANAALARWLWWPNRWRNRLQRYTPAVANPIIAGLKRLNARPIPLLSSSMKKELQTLFLDDFVHLEDLLGRHVPWR